MARSTNNGKKGGLLKGEPHSRGGIKAVVTDTNQPVELEGGEVIINKEASKKHWRELSRINQSAGDGVPILPPNGADSSDEFKRGGKTVEFNPNDLPNKRIYEYAKKIRDNHPDVWNASGSDLDDEAFKNLERVIKRGYWTDGEDWMYEKWQHHKSKNYSSTSKESVLANLKWLHKVQRGWDYMKAMIEKEVRKSEKEDADKTVFKTGGVITYKQKYNKKYGYSANESHSLSQIAKDTGRSIKGLQQIYNKGIGAYKTNPQSVRPNVKSKEQWAMARVYSAVMGGKASRVDANELKMAQGGGIPQRYRNMGFDRVGQKKQSTNPQKKWMVLAKKGDKYKVVHGGYKGMQDFSQHHDEKRRDRFWNRMGGKDSAKANDPFSPLYWHKKFHTWESGGNMTSDGYNSELAKGIKEESEHRGTANKLYNRQITPSQAPKSIAKEHLKEDANYYSKLELLKSLSINMGKPDKRFAKGGKVTLDKGVKSSDVLYYLTENKIQYVIRYDKTKKEFYILSSKDPVAKIMLSLRYYDFANDRDSSVKVNLDVVARQTIYSNNLNNFRVLGQLLRGQWIKATFANSEGDIITCHKQKDDSVNFYNDKGVMQYTTLSRQYFCELLMTENWKLREVKFGNEINSITRNENDAYLYNNNIFVFSRKKKKVTDGNLKLDKYVLAPEYVVADKKWYWHLNKVDNDMSYDYGVWDSLEELKKFMIEDGGFEGFDLREFKDTKIKNDEDGRTFRLFSHFFSAWGLGEEKEFIVDECYDHNDFRVKTDKTFAFYRCDGKKMYFTLDGNNIDYQVDWVFNNMYNTSDFASFKLRQFKFTSDGNTTIHNFIYEGETQQAVETPTQPQSQEVVEFNKQEAMAKFLEMNTISSKEIGMDEYAKSVIENFASVMKAEKEAFGKKAVKMLSKLN